MEPASRIHRPATWGGEGRSGASEVACTVGSGQPGRQGCQADSEHPQPCAWFLEQGLGGPARRYGMPSRATMASQDSNAREALPTWSNWTLLVVSLMPRDLQGGSEYIHLLTSCSGTSAVPWGQGTAEQSAVLCVAVLSPPPTSAHIHLPEPSQLAGLEGLQRAGLESRREGALASAYPPHGREPAPCCTLSTARSC